MLVHGADAGWNAADYAKNVGIPEPDITALADKKEAATLPLMREKGLRPAQVRRRVQEMAHKHLGPIRSREELQDFIDFLENVKKDELPNLSAASKTPAYNKEWIDALELDGMVALLEAAARSALARTESRGVHYREDFPQTDNDNWLRESIVGLNGGGLKIGSRPVATTTITPPGGVTPYLDMLKKMMEAHSDVGGHH